MKREKFIANSSGAIYLPHRRCNFPRGRIRISIATGLGLVLLCIIPALMVAKEEPKKLNLAVAEFEGRDVATTEAMAVNDFLRTDLVRMELFNVVGRDRMKMILAQQKFEMSGCTDRQCVQDMGLILHVDKIVYGTLARVGTQYCITANVINVQTGKIEFSKRQKLAGLDVDQLSAAVDKLAALLANRLLGKRIPGIVRPGVMPAVREEELARGSVRIESTPPGADILLNGEPVGKTPMKIKDITATSHQVVLMMEGYVDKEMTVNIIADQTIQASADLTPMLGMIIVNSVPQGADVYLDGKYQGKAEMGGLKIKAVPLGKHKLTLKKGKKFYAYEEEIEVKYKQTNEITAQLKEKPGALFISSTPKGAKIYVDDAYKGITPLKIAELAAGKHEVKLNLEGFKEYKTEKTIIGLKTVSLTADLEPLPLYPPLEKRELEGVRQRPILKKVKPEYPLSAREKGIAGKVKLEIQVLPEGTVQKAKVLESSGFSILDDSAQRAVYRWVFQPLPVGSTEIQTGAIEIIFRLK